MITLKSRNNNVLHKPGKFALPPPQIYNFADFNGFNGKQVGWFIKYNSLYTRHKQVTYFNRIYRYYIA